MGSGWSSLREGAEAIALQSSVVLKVQENSCSSRISSARCSTHQVFTDDLKPSSLSQGAAAKALQSSMAAQIFDKYSVQQSTVPKFHKTLESSSTSSGSGANALQSSSIAQIPRINSAGSIPLQQSAPSSSCPDFNAKTLQSTLIPPLVGLSLTDRNATQKEFRTSVGSSEPGFKKFLKLPPELQLMIWKFSYEPRVIEMRFAKAYTSTQYDFVVKKLPAILHVSRNIREEALKDYQLLFKHKQCRAPTYFNPEIDTLHLRDSKSSEYIDYEQVSRTLSIMPDKEKIQRLSVTNDSKALTQKPLILEFPKLKEVTVSFRLEEALLRNMEGGHIGACRRTGGCGPCFPNFNALIYIFEIAHSQIMVAFLLKDVQSKVWGNLDWQEPEFQYKAMCTLPWTYSQLRCPYIGAGNARAKL